jgi:hypothetical protein
MKSTTVRFADSVYRDLEAASRLTGLPINSIVTVACLEWLRQNVTGGDTVPAIVGVTPAWRAMRLRRLEQQTISLAADPAAAGAEPQWVFTAGARDALARAMQAAERSRRPWIGTGHLLQGLAEVADGRAAQVLARLGVDAVALAGSDADEPAERPDRRLPTRQVRRALRRAQDEAERDGSPQIGTHHLLLGLLLERDAQVAEALRAAGVTEPTVRAALNEMPEEE